MRVLVVYAHPVETSLAAALHRAVVDALTEAGHQVDDCDLYAEGFQPALTRAERLDYHDTSCNRAAVDTYVERLLDAEAFVVVCPVWNFGFPAILKGYFDRVFLPGVSFRLENGAIYPNLTQHQARDRRNHLWGPALARLPDGRSAAQDRQAGFAICLPHPVASFLPGALRSQQRHTRDLPGVCRPRAAEDADPLSLRSSLLRPELLNTSPGGALTTVRPRMAACPRAAVRT